VGLIEPDGVLLVLYRDGSLYARTGWTAGHFAALLAAPSKGAFLRATTGGSVRILGAENTEPCCWPTGGPVRVLGKEDTVSGNARAPIAVKPCKNTGVDTAAQAETPSAPVPKPLNLIDADADPCCRKAFYRASELTSPFTCAECGTQFYVELIAGERYWRIKCNVAIARPR
jgi:hypothetical protein